jgi:hypothetical protein
MSKDTDGGFNVICKSCNRPFTVSPPGSEFVRILQENCERGDSIPIKNTCPSCDHQNTIIWDMDHSLPFNRDESSDLNLAGHR